MNSTIALKSSGSLWGQMQTINRKIELFSKCKFPVLLQQTWTERLNRITRYSELNAR